jgi:hypothetical protein
MCHCMQFDFAKGLYGFPSVLWCKTGLCLWQSSHRTIATHAEPRLYHKTAGKPYTEQFKLLHVNQRGEEVGRRKNLPQQPAPPPSRMGVFLQ